MNILLDNESEILKVALENILEALGETQLSNINAPLRYH